MVSDKLTAEWLEDKFRVCWNGKEHVLPLRSDAHNSYIVISSAAYLLRESHDFWRVNYLMDHDVHALLVTTKLETEELTSKYSGPVSRYFTRFEPGHDYFSGIDVPYLGHEDNNPHFEAQRDAVAPILTRLREVIAQQGAQLREEYREREAWLEGILRDVNAPEVNVAEVTRMSAEFAKRNAQTLEEFAAKIALLRQEISQIVEDTER